MPASILARLERLETALGESSGTMACPVCRARPPVVGPWTPDPEPAHCLECGADWQRWSFTLRIGPARGVWDAEGAPDEAWPRGAPERARRSRQARCPML